MKRPHIIWMVDLKDVDGHSSSVLWDLQFSLRVAILNAMFDSSRVSGRLAATTICSRMLALSLSELLLKIFSYASETEEGRLDNKSCTLDILLYLLRDLSMMLIVRKSYR